MVGRSLSVAANGSTIPRLVRSRALKNQGYPRHIYALAVQIEYR